MKARILLTFAFLAALIAPALAHTLSETHSAWHVTGSTIDMNFTLPDIEAQRLAPSGQNATDAMITAYLGKHLAATADGKACTVNYGPEKGTAAQGFTRWEFSFTCPKAAKDIQLVDTAFFDLVPTHINYAQIITSDGVFIEQLFTRDQTSLHAAAGGDSPLQNAGFLTYVGLGIMHILTGVDHMSFLLGLILISRRLKDLAFVVTGFTLGHSATLALAVTGIVRPHAQYIDALVALTIALIGAENIAVSLKRPGTIALAFGGTLVFMALLQWMGAGGLPALLLLGAGIFTGNYLMITGHLQDAARIRVIVTLVFGLIHGFGFASSLLEMRLPTGRMAELLLGFNSGVEVGQLSLVLGVTLIAWLLVKVKFALPRPIVTDVCAAFLVGIGVFWFVSRSYA
ncbi:MAG: HupE/UreJ family protein [Pseudomonadota bacterium]